MTKNTLTYDDFIHAAKIGGLDTIQAYQEQGADIHAENDNAFRWSAAKGTSLSCNSFSNMAPIFM